MLKLCHAQLAEDDSDTVDTIHSTPSHNLHNQIAVDIQGANRRPGAHLEIRPSSEQVDGHKSQGTNTGTLGHWDTRTQGNGTPRATGHGCGNHRRPNMGAWNPERRRTNTHRDKGNHRSNITNTPQPT